LGINPFLFSDNKKAYAIAIPKKPATASAKSGMFRIGKTSSYPRLNAAINSPITVTAFIPPPNIRTANPKATKTISEREKLVT
jgi:hypothetical protein